VDEPLGMTAKGIRQDLSTVLEEGTCVSIVHGSGGHHTDRAVVVLVVVPVEKLTADRAGVLVRAEAVRKLRPVLQA
jgi:hypothetical protein